MSLNSYALSVVTETRLAAKDEALVELQRSAINQLNLITGLRREEALRALLVGAQLLRIKESMPRGTWMPWVEQNLTTGQRWVNYTMRLALVFFEKSRVSKSDLLALPGEQVELGLDGQHGSQCVFIEKAVKFVGELSTTELLQKHGIRETKNLGGARVATEAAPKPVASAEQMAHATRDEIGSAIERLEMLLIKECRLAYVGHDHDFLRGVRASLGDLSLKVHQSVEDLISLSKPAAKAPVTVTV